MPRKRKKRRGRRASRLAKLSVADITRELERRRGMLGAMERTRAGLANELAAVDAEIASLEAMRAGREVSAPRRRRPHLRAVHTRTASGSPDRRVGPRKNSLASALLSLLRGRTMSVAELTQAAKKAGYKSKSKEFQKVVALNVLNRRLFRRVRRGYYTAK